MTQKPILKTDLSKRLAQALDMLEEATETISILGDELAAHNMIDTEAWIRHWNRDFLKPEDEFLD